MVDDEKSMLHIARKILIFEEGYRDRVYASYEGGTDTAGIGHKLTPSEAKKWRRGMEVPGSQIEAWFIEDIGKASKASIKWLGKPTFDRLGPLRQALCLCMAFQMGEAGIMAWTETAEHVRLGEWADVRVHIFVSKWAMQTPKRARRMAKMWTESRLLEEYEPRMQPDGA